MSGALVFVTDYGLEDGYAAQLRAAAWAVEPGLRCVDGTHLVPHGDVLTGAYHCKTLAGGFGPGTLLCAVVDPGVGGDRRAIAVECDGVRCVAPDNGLITYLWEEAAQKTGVRLPVPSTASATFHGRDVFAPVAARLAAGASLSDVGDLIESPVLREELLPRRGDDGWGGHIVCIDHFGNAITSLRRRDMSAKPVVTSLAWAAGQTATVVRTYSEIDTGLALLWNSADHLEIAAREASAASAGGLAVGMPVVVR